MELPIIIEDSPVEFVLTGPFNGADQVIVKSEHAMLDLVGSIALASARASKRRNTFIDTIFYSDKRKVNVTQGSLYMDILDTEDARSSNYFLAWSGQARSGTLAHVDLLIDVRIHEIVKAIRTGNKGNLEWTLAAPIHVIAEDEEYYKTRRRTMRLIIGMYLALAAMTITIHFLSPYIQNI